MTATWMVTPTRLIHVTVDTVATPEKCQDPKAVTVAWMVTLIRLIPVTVDTFDTHKNVKPQNDDCYVDGDHDPPDPCDC